MMPLLSNTLDRATTSLLPLTLVILLLMSGEDPLGVLVDSDVGDGRDICGESVLGNDANSQNAGATLSSTDGTPSGKEDLYQQRFEEGYNLIDPYYILWLEQHHQQ